jgi:4-diphosphocytidyl-2-C-methyl-D-erythritol kinase
MTSRPRRARVNALAKINLDLRVLQRRADGFHELRTVYQTISLADRLDVEFTPARRTRIELCSDVVIADNLVERAARLAMEAMRATGVIRFRLEKRIPMGAGLGGGSSDAAAVLLALPPLAGRRIPLEVLIRLAAELGSDVPFFLLGGTALGIGRGSEVYPLPDLPRAKGILVAPGIHVSTAEAYQALGRNLTTEPPDHIISIFESYIWRKATGVPERSWPALGGNDFEEAVLGRHPRLKSIKRKLLRAGAAPAMLTGSGSALFGIFRTREKLEQALPFFQKERTFPFVSVSRAAYRAMWRRRLRAYIDDEELWLPQNRDAS